MAVTESAQLKVDMQFMQVDMQFMQVDMHSRHLFFLLHKVYISDFLTVQTYTEVQKQTMSF